MTCNGCGTNIVKRLLGDMRIAAVSVSLAKATVGIQVSRRVTVDLSFAKVVL